MACWWEFTTIKCLFCGMDVFAKDYGFHVQLFHRDPQGAIKGWPVGEERDGRPSE